jgi:CHAT domain-containing protein
MLDQGVLKPGDHICYSPDEALHNIPLQYLQLGDGIVLDLFSVSRVASCLQLATALQRPAMAPRRFAGFVLPAQEDLAKEGGEKMLAAMKAPVEWLASHGLPGETALLAEATPQRLMRQRHQGEILHLSVHGWFPPDGNPYHESYLLLAGEDGLPQAKVVAQGSAYSGRVTPEGFIDARVDLGGCHVSMMACVSGLAREGIGGDALGLDWAFLQAGASSVISTHWAVSAQCASDFFRAFYQQWVGEGQSRAGAWRQAMRACIGHDRSPASLDRWSGFSLTGDFR